MSATGQQSAVMEMDIATRQTSKATIVDLTGPLRLGESSQAFRNTLECLKAEGVKNLVVNLSCVSDVDSSGIGALVRAHTMMRQLTGQCKFFAPSKRVMQVLKVVRLETVLELFEDEATALLGF
jgi:anti-sigma B factor antagonist